MNSADAPMRAHNRHSPHDATNARKKKESRAQACFKSVCFLYNYNIEGAQTASDSLLTEVMQITCGDQLFK